MSAAVAWLAIARPWRERSWYRARVVVPGSLLIAGVGAVWTVIRLWAG